jgi:hypothetical protein
MAAPGDIFHVCRHYRPDRTTVPPEEQAVATCATCAHQYGERPCPIFRTRFLRALGLETTKTQPEREALE